MPKLEEEIEIAEEPPAVIVEALVIAKSLTAGVLLTVIDIPVEVEGLPVAQEASEVNKHVTTSPFDGA